MTMVPNQRSDTGNHSLAAVEMDAEVRAVSEGERERVVSAFRDDLLSNPVRVQAVRRELRGKRAKGHTL